MFNKTMFNKTAAITTLCAGAALVMPTQVHAYLDPGTGSIILQGLLAAIAAGSIAIKLYWGRLVALLRGKRFPATPVETDLSAEAEDRNAKS